ncbi:MAG: aminotransferase class III-fold pyridoxal phosphate-dependent enzyme, partial [Phycisphaerae bacterium]|nr:aminotransferase class III-fold pyridoxal phosphate-dependent enzyme [Phycisphaerae bacterium]NIW43555.1 aminotransferase class III-fold pyridoxal phosphate-dependent enzyme [Gammaproteobacteria bacterium]NIW97983.1 aminotransferase class III-fold pyridoxal phosphate-dependent enzyme [Phycisphaerae bacterium]NIX28668.1 aminotransferase class III-fold pyridoxal phosphate-dependent enzyme [Phycisphaerae bacterium]
LTSQLPEQLDQVYLVNSGTEATEGALKLAKKYTGRSKLVSFHNSYHGDTQGSLSVTGRD